MHIMKSLFAALVLTAILTSAQAASITSQQSGNWSDTNIWIGGVVPTTNDTAVIMNIVTQNLATLEVFQIDIRNGCALKMDGSAATGDSMAHTIKFTDSSGCGFVTLTHGGTIIIKGDATYRQTVTTAAAGSPSNWWNFSLLSPNYSPTFTAEHTTFSYFYNFQTYLIADDGRVNLHNCTFAHAGKSCFYSWPSTIGSVSNIVLEYNNDSGINDDAQAFRGFYGSPTNIFYNVVITNTSPTFMTMQIYGHDMYTKFEFRNSNWNLDNIGSGGGQTYLNTYPDASMTNAYCCLVSANHNDVAGDYRLILGNRLAETNLLQKFDGQDLKFSAKVYNPYYGYLPGTLVVDREIKVNSLTMDDKSYLDLSAGYNIYYKTTASYTPANIIGPGRIYRDVPRGTVISCK